uniref:Protein Shroom1 n=1 Tax=Pogona vitticeps TaxID=103695 RepID=A0A6J0VF68_9SAUR
MSSCENGVSGWNPRHIRGIDELLEPVASLGDDSRFAPEKPLGGIDQCLHIPGKADSAYSSFSGGSNLPEFPVPLCYSEQDSPLEQLPYMDTGYVTGIYNPCAIPEELRQIYEHKGTGKSSHYKLEATGLSGLHGSTPIPGALHPSPSPLGKFPSPLPCPPAQLESYKANTDVDQTPGICFDCSIQADMCIQEIRKDLLSDAATNCYNDYCLSRGKDETPVTEKRAGCLAKAYTVKKKNSFIFITPSAFSQEKLMPDSSQTILQAQNAIHAYKIPEMVNSDSFPLLQTSHNAVNDTQKNKQCFHACSVHKPPTAEGDLPSTVAVSSQPEGQIHPALQLSRIQGRSALEQDICIRTTHLKYTDSSLPGKSGLGIINSYEEKKGFICSEGENSRNIWQPLLKQQTTMQKPHSHSLDFTETPHAIIYEPTNTVSYYSHDAEDTISQPFNGFRKPEENDHYSSPELLMNSRQDEMLHTVGFPKQPCSKKAESQSQEDSASEKINRRTTPLLYYLSGGKNPNIMSHEAHNALDPDVSSVNSPRSACPVSAIPVKILGDNNQHVDETACTDEGLIMESCASASLDENFKNDYREKLKVAQSKVLRETSFKRKDLQMSLPIRLKQKASSRPSIQHLRSLSLSSTNEEPESVPPLKPLGHLRKEEESQRLPNLRIGGRKRATTEQKKISYSEPEKLNQLEDQRDQNESWKKKNARSHSDEISEQDTRILRIKSMESRGRALTKAELKQIQHKALLEYMERKTGQQPAPASNNNMQQQKPPLQGRTANPKRFSEDTSNSGKLQSMDGLCRILEPSSFPTASTSVDPRASNFASTKCFIRSVSSATSKGHGGSRSTPLPVQDFYTPTACLTSPAEDHGHYLSHPKAETGQNGRGANHQHLQDNCESTLRHLPRQSLAEDSTGYAFEHPHNTKRSKDKLPSTLASPSLSPAPLPTGRRSLCSNVQGESRDSSPVLSLTEMDEDVFKDSSASVSDMDSNLPHFPRQSLGLTVVRETSARTSTAPVLQISMKEKPIKEEQAMSFTAAGKYESNPGNNKKDEDPCSPGIACEYPAFCLQKESNTNFQLKKEMSEESQGSSVSHGQHLEGNDRTHPSEEGAYHGTALLDHLGCKNTGCPIVNSKALQNDFAYSIPVQAADSLIAQSKSPEDPLCGDHAVEIIAKDKSLADILTPHPIRKTALELMEGLFPVNLSRPGRSYRWKQGIQFAQENDQRSSEYPTDPSIRASNYLGQGAEDATFHIHQMLSKNKENLDDPENITSPKRELISSIQLKLQTLWAERELIQSEVKEHVEHGRALESMVQDLCKPNEYERYMMFIVDLEKVVSLLLCLSSRLARVENAMEKIDENTDAEEKQSLNERHKLLSRQREDAKDLKENLDRRERVVSGILSKYMTENQLQDYRHFVQEKTSLLIEQKDLDEEIKFLEEQLERLQKSIVP